MLKVIFTFLIFTTLFFCQETQTNSLIFNGISDINQSPSDDQSNVNFELGLRDEIAFQYTKLYNYRDGYSNYTKSAFLPINLHLAAGLRFSEYYKIDFRIGIIYVFEDFSGIDKGIFLQANLFKSNFYGTLGIDFFNNCREAHGIMVYSESGGDITSFCFGIGYNLSKHFDLEVSYYLPTNKVYGYNQVNYGAIHIQRYEKINNGLLIIGFQYNFLF